VAEIQFERVTITSLEGFHWTSLSGCVSQNSNLINVDDACCQVDPCPNRSIGAPKILGRVFHCLRIRMSLCYELNSSAERERNKQTAPGRNTQCTDSSCLITSTSEFLLRQNSVTAHAHQSQARQLVSDHCATENHRPKSAVRPIAYQPSISSSFLLNI
jgi:hypothetical protein